jgi:hypothetical protein
MPSTTGHSVIRSETAQPLRWTRDEHMGAVARGLGQALADGSSRDGRPAPPVLAEAPVLVLHDGGPGGDAALRHAIGACRGPLTIVRTWEPADPILAARVGGQLGAGTEILRVVHVQNERAREAAEAEAASAVALAEAAGREATGVVRRLDGRLPPTAQLRRLVEAHRPRHLVLAAPVRRGRRFLRAAGAHERLVAELPCAVTVVPVPE